MTDQSRRRIVFVRPRKDFGSLARCCELAGIERLPETYGRFLDVPLLAFLLDANGVPIWEPILYLAHCAMRSRSVTGDTIRTYAEALHDWFRFMDHLQTDLQTVTEDTLASFRCRLAHRPDAGRRMYASATANLRISVVCAFHLWAHTHGVVETPLGAFLAARRVEQKAHHRLGARRGVALPRSLAPAVVQRMPRSLSRDEISLIFQEATPTYRLIFKWALVTGLRRCEICRLEVEQLPSPQQLGFSRDGLVQINMLRKGSRDITVHVPVKLIEETRWYLLTERPRPRTAGEPRLFLGRQGTPISRQSVSRAFRMCADRVGTGATFHHLRHTFAVHVLKILDRAELDGRGANSLKTLQVLMGHASFESTEIYLRSMEVSSDFVMQALDYLYGATL